MGEKVQRRIPLLRERNRGQAGRDFVIADFLFTNR
jgi:hypothetical protein